MAISALLPVKARITVTQHAPVVDIEGNVRKGETQVHFKVEQLKDIIPFEQIDGYFILKHEDEVASYLPGAYGCVANFGIPHYRAGDFGIISLKIGAQVHDVWDV